VSGLHEANRRLFDGPFGSAYSFYMERPRLARVVAGAVWGGDPRPTYELLAAVGELPDGSTVVDAPCGAGLGFRCLSPRQRLRYLALDISPAMVERARRKAAASGLDQVEVVEGDAERIPVPDGSADLFLSMWGLHCLPHPAEAVREAARCLRPGGRLLGAMICTGNGVRQRLLVRPSTGVFGPTGSSADLSSWLSEAGLATTRLDVSGPFAYFDARRPSV
jgi:SAM-dependent methyltransferase